MPLFSKPLAQLIDKTRGELSNPVGGSGDKNGCEGGSGDVQIPQIKSALASSKRSGENKSKRVRFKHVLETRTNSTDDDSTDSEEDDQDILRINRRKPKRTQQKELLQDLKMDIDQDDSDAWETEDEEIEMNKNVKYYCPPGPFETGEGDFSDPVHLFNPMNFSYVNLGTKVVDDYVLRFDLKRRKKKLKVKGARPSLRDDFEEGADLDLEPPQVILKVDPDTLGIRRVSEILESRDLTISQKYKSLGIDDEALLDEEPQEGSGWWEWLSYKLHRFYYSQWPSVSNLNV